MKNEQDKQKSPSFEKALFKTDPKEYSDAYTEHLIEQYKLYVQSHEKISERRQETNRFFLTLNTLLLGGVSYLLDAQNELHAVMLTGLVAGIIACYFWYRIIKSYDGLNTGKFVVIHAIEDRLPLALYDTEWQVLGEGKDPNKYLPFTHIERKVPVIFIAAYLILALVFAGTTLMAVIASCGH